MAKAIIQQQVDELRERIVYVDRFILSKIFQLSIYDEECKFLQGICKHENIIYCSFVNEDSSSQKIVSYDTSSSAIVRSRTFSSLGHANDIAYKDGKLYVADDGTNGIVKIIDADSDSISEQSKTVPFNVSRIAYDNIDDVFVLGDSELYVYDGTLSSEIYHFSAVPTQTIQGMCAHNGIVYTSYSALEDRKGFVGVNSVIAYNYKGDVVKNWVVEWNGELEDIDTDGEYIYFGFNPNYESHVSFFKAAISRTIDQANSLDAFAVSDVNTPLMMEGSCTIYCTKGAKEGGDGSIQRPFCHIEDVVRLLVADPHQYNIVNVQLNGDFSDEKIVYINNINKFVIIDGGKIFGARISNCRSFRLSGIEFTGYGGTEKSSLYGENSFLDIRNLVFSGGDSESVGLYTNRCDLYFSTENTFNNFLYAAKLYTSRVVYATSIIDNGCTNKISANSFCDIITTVGRIGEITSDASSIIRYKDQVA